MSMPTYITGTVQTQAYRLLRARVYEVLSEYGLTPTHWAMLGIILQARDGVRQVEIAKTLHVKAPLVTGLAKVLAQQGLIQSVTNQFDARAKLLAVTPAGKKQIKNIETDMDRMLGKLLSGLTKDEMRVYHKVLLTIIENDSRLN